MDEIKRMIKVAYEALSEKQAEDIRIIDISGVSTVADYFVITNGKNHNHVHSLVDNVREKMYKAGFECKAVEGYQYAVWVLLDYQDVVINIFSGDDRRFYDLERIWRDGKIIEDISELE